MNLTLVNNTDRSAMDFWGKTTSVVIETLSASNDKLTVQLLYFYLVSRLMTFFHKQYDQVSPFIRSLSIEQFQRLLCLYCAVMVEELHGIEPLYNDANITGMAIRHEPDTGLLGISVQWSEPSFIDFDMHVYQLNHESKLSSLAEVNSSKQLVDLSSLRFLSDSIGLFLSHSRVYQSKQVFHLLPAYINFLHNLFVYYGFIQLDYLYPSKDVIVIRPAFTRHRYLMLSQNNEQDHLTMEMIFTDQTVYQGLKGSCLPICDDHVKRIFM